ncbi:hypothetical protein NLD30_10835 [SCandidatus Aminicenantes bacterium Aminicenantia_JdfR_composite]|jgi:epoxyqueuosine reductase QueG|nr:hypothetical protein [SCandidatus Aminicenantes bacterium Aminicenantia_JdfR_composite]MCP2598628.1 hypothetical protein [Candidatus Aminicenantes bacterium AC-335-L06]
MKKEERNYILLKNFVFAREINLFGVADIAEIKNEFLLDKETIDGFDKAISLGFKLNYSILEEIQNKPTKLYYHHYRQVNFLLDRVSLSLSSFIERMGYRALPIPASQIIDWEKQRAHLSHKKIGMLAGLGWIGRNNLLVNPEIGARFRLVTVLTDMPLKIDKPIKYDCGKCKACISVCPANAIKEQKENFDHLACFEKLKEFRKEGISNQYICGICVKCCKGLEK